MTIEMNVREMNIMIIEYRHTNRTVTIGIDTAGLVMCQHHIPTPFVILAEQHSRDTCRRLYVPGTVTYTYL